MLSKLTRLLSQVIGAFSNIGYIVFFRSVYNCIFFLIFIILLGLIVSPLF